MALDRIQEIEIPLDLSQGTFYNTEYRDGFLQLKRVRISDNENEVFYPFGYWESDDSFMKDKVSAFKRLASDRVIVKNGTYRILTASSPDRSNWTPWNEINGESGEIISPVNQFAKVRIEITSSHHLEVITTDDFSVQGKYNHPFVNSDEGVLELKKKHHLEMIKNEQWNEPGVVFKRKIQKNVYKKINKLALLPDVAAYHFIKYGDQYISYRDGIKNVLSEPGKREFESSGMLDLNILKREKKKIRRTMTLDEQGSDGRIYRKHLSLRKEFQIIEIKIT